MVQIIAGKKGKGKTKHLLDRANSAIRDSKGSIVYLDKSSKHMYELSNKIRLINVNEYPIKSRRIYWFYLWNYFTGSRFGNDVFRQLFKTVLFRR